MVKIILNIKNSLEKNASDYFEHAKRLKKKLERTKKAIARLEIKKEKAEKKQAKQEVKVKVQMRERDWYEKFHWFFSSEGFLVIGGRDATTNEIVIKKHTQASDIIFHTDTPGSPFFVIQTRGEVPGEITIKETAIATASYSKAWKLGILSLDVFHVSPDQVTKEAKAGEFISKGAFMVYGKKTYSRPMVGLALGLYDDKVMAGALSVIEKHCSEYVEIEPGKDKKSIVGKAAQKILNGGLLDDYISVIPAGGSHMKKKRINPKNKYVKLKKKE